MSEVRVESDSMGTVEVPADHYWGAQTERSLHHFAIGLETMPPALIRAFGILKFASAQVNRDLGKLDSERASLVERASREVIDVETAPASCSRHPGAFMARAIRSGSAANCSRSRASGGRISSSS